MSLWLFTRYLYLIWKIGLWGGSNHRALIVSNMQQMHDAIKELNQVELNKLLAKRKFKI